MELNQEDIEEFLSEFGESAEEVKDVSLKDISEAVQTMIALEDDIRRKEIELGELQERFKELNEEQIPEMLELAGMKSFELPDGRKVGVQNVLYCNIPSKSAIEKAKGEDRDKLIERRNACLNWLRENGSEDLIKGKIIVDVDRGDDKMAQQLRKQVEDQGLHCKQDVSVHNATLSSHFREMKNDGQDLPEELFKIFEKKKTKVSK